MRTRTCEQCSAEVVEHDRRTGGTVLLDPQRVPAAPGYFVVGPPPEYLAHLLGPGDRPRLARSVRRPHQCVAEDTP